MTFAHTARNVGKNAFNMRIRVTNLQHDTLIKPNRRHLEKQ
jgi:hypothetical protein